jgi:hypothetical protein
MIIPIADKITCAILGFGMILCVLVSSSNTFGQFACELPQAGSTKINTYKNPIFGYKFSYPDVWIVDNTSTIPGAVYLVNPHSGNMSVASVGIGAANIQDKLTGNFSDGKDYVERAILRVPVGSQLIERCPINFGSWSGSRIIYSHDSHIYMTTAFAVNNSMMYSINIGGVDKDTYASTLPYLKIIFDSFTP